MHRNYGTLIAAAAASWLFAPAAFSQDPAAQPTAEDEAESPAIIDPSDPAMMPTDPELGEPVDEEAAAMPAPPVDPASSAPIDDQKIEQFANAYMEVQTIQQRAAADMQSAADPAEQEQVRTTAETDMIAAVERSGLQVEEFNQIVQSLASDVEVRNRVAAKLQERSGG